MGKMRAGLGFVELEQALLEISEVEESFFKKVVAGKRESANVSSFF